MRKAMMIFLAGITTLNIVAQNIDTDEILSAEQQKIAVVSSYIISGDFIHTQKIVNKKFDLDFSLGEIENILNNTSTEYDSSPLHSYAMNKETRTALDTDEFLREYFFEDSFVNRDIDRDIEIAALLERTSGKDIQLAVNDNFVK